MARLDVEILTEPERVMLLLHGELDMATEAQLRDVAMQQLAAHDLAKLQLDLADVTFLDSTGVSALVDLHKEATDRGVDLEIVAASHRAARVLTIVGLAEHFGLPPDPETVPPASEN
jgi:anti-anti-sigma factor